VTTPKNPVGQPVLHKPNVNVSVQQIAKHLAGLPVPAWHIVFEAPNAKRKSTRVRKTNEGYAVHVNVLGKRDDHASEMIRILPALSLITYYDNKKGRYRDNDPYIINYMS
jgi:hypothetical protein